jgi:hypothetical protein
MFTAECLPQHVYRSKKNRSSDWARARCNAQPSAFTISGEHAFAERLPVAVLASSWGDRPGGEKFWATFRRENNFVWRPETKIRDAATTR